MIWAFPHAAVTPAAVCKISGARSHASTSGSLRNAGGQLATLELHDTHPSWFRCSPERRLTRSWVGWQEDVGDLNVVVTVASARLKADPGVPAFRLEFRASGSVVGDVTEHLSRANVILNEAFRRLIPDPDRRFS